MDNAPIFFAIMNCGGGIMELKSVGVFGDCFEPDKSHPFNFVLDTTAINKLAERPEDVKLLKMAGAELAYEFFVCRIQHGEVVGMKSDGSFHKYFSASDEKSKQMRTIIDTLPARRIPCLAAFVQRGILLDGTSYLVDSHGKLYEVFENVFNNNPENIEDAIIVESAIRHNCIVISNDRAMCENTNAVFPGSAMWYTRFIKETQAKLI